MQGSLMLDIGGTWLTAEDRRLLRQPEVGGVIREICVEDAQPVEFGQVLYRVDPNG